MRIHITGASGSGVTTLGAALAAKLGIPAVDADTFYWVPTQTPFTQKRDRDERLAMALRELAKSRDAVFSGSCLDWGAELEDSFDLVVFLYLETAVRLERLRLRELKVLGHVDEEFLSWAAQYDAGTATGRSLTRHRAWLAARRCPVVELHGDLSVEERVSRVLDALAALSEEGARRRWDDFFSDRTRPCGFFGTSPDENLVRWVEGGLLSRGRALDVGCGNGRNAIYLARQGFQVDAIDLSKTAVDWARSNAAAAGMPVDFSCGSVFDVDPEPSFDLVYDSGCFHHLWPHQRAGYVALIARLLQPGGTFGLVCFRPEGGSGYSDEEVQRHGSLGGGLGYTEDALRTIWSPAVDIICIERMAKPLPDSGQFGEAFLWTLLANSRTAL